jgi:hypothetical protein
MKNAMIGLGRMGSAEHRDIFKAKAVKIMLAGTEGIVPWPSAQERKEFIKANHIGIQTKICKILG